MDREWRLWPPKAARPCFPRDIGGRPDRQGHDGEGGILLSKCGEAATVHNKQILDRRGLGNTDSEPNCTGHSPCARPSFVARETARFRVVVHLRSVETTQAHPLVAACG